MENLDWTTLLIVATVVTAGLMLLSFVWRLLKRFIKVWLVILVALALFKVAYDAGWLGSV